MELPTRYFNAAETVLTNMGNKVSRRCSVCGSQNIVLAGHSILMEDCIIRGDLANVRIGKYCSVGARTVIRPPYKHFSRGLTFFPVHIGDHVTIEEDCVIVGVHIGSYVHIGRGAVVSASCVIKDCAQVLAGAVLAPDTVVPPFAVFGGNPARRVGELPAATPQLMLEATTSLYERYIPREPASATTAVAARA